MPGIGVVNNPYSRRNKQNPEWMRSLGYITGTSGEAVATRSTSDIHEMIRIFSEKDIDILAINGGDGSNSLVLSALIEEYGDKPLPKIALLRGGTMNIAANSCGIKGSSAGLMVNLVHKYREDIPFETTFCDILEIEGRYGFVFGNGFTHRFLEVLYESGKKTPLSAIKQLAKGSLSTITGGKLARRLFERVEARVLLDGQEWPAWSFAALAASTVEQMGLGFKPFHRSQERPHTFHMLGIVSSPAAVVTSLPRIYLGRKVSERKMLEDIASEVLIESKKPISYTLDGENYTTGHELGIVCGPRLEIIVC
jgi:diacylglycerol kinase (ATP)